MTKQYKLLAVISLLLGAVAVILYLPYTFDAFGVNCNSWFELSQDILKQEYFNVLTYVGVGLLGLIIVFNLISIFKRPNIAKICFKVCTIIALLLPIVFVMALNIDKFNWAREFWVEYIAKNLKTYAYIAIGASAGLFIVALVRNFTADSKANFHHIFKALMMIALLVMMAYCFNWCKWTINANIINKIYGILIGWLAIYFVLSAVVLLICARFERE